MYRSTSLVLTLALIFATGSITSAQAVPSLQERVDRLAEQVHLRYRHHDPSLTQRREAIAAALAEWNRRGASGDTVANRQMMNDWLDAAMVAVMPGGTGVMPEVPRFVTQIAPVASLAPDVRSRTASAPIEAVPPTASQSADPRVIRSEASPVARRSQFSAPRAAQQRSAAKPVTPVLEKPRTPAPQRSKWSRNPSAAPLEWRDPFVDDPAASPNPLRSGVRLKTRRPVAPPARAARIDLRQLAADVRGYNGAIRDLQVLVLGLRDSDIFGLVEAADELGRLEERRQFLELYRSGLTVSQRAALPGSPSVELIRELVVRKATAMTRQSSPRQRAEQQALEQLRERLARTSGLGTGAF